MGHLKYSLYALFLTLSFSAFAQQIVLKYEHGGRNGGDGLEIKVELMAKKIVHFLHQSTGQNAFPEINAPYLKTVVEQTSFNFTSEPLLDKYGETRTCTNEQSKLEIICNSERWALLQDKSVQYILIFHEILGLINLELGYQNDVSVYPISFKLIQYIEEVDGISLASTPARNQDYSSVKALSWGAEIISAQTGEKIRVICLDAIETHKCQNFSFVRTYEGKQAPLTKDSTDFSSEDLAKIHTYLQGLKKKAYIEKYELKIIDHAQSLTNFKGSMSLMGKRLTLKEKDFKNLENLILLSILNK